MESWQVVQNYIHLAFVMSFFVCVSVCEGGEEKMRLFEEGKKMFETAYACDTDLMEKK